MTFKTPSQKMKIYPEERKYNPLQYSRFGESQGEISPGLQFMVLQRTGHDSGTKQQQ